MRKQSRVWLPILIVCFATFSASGQSFRVQCPSSTITHPVAANNNSEPSFSDATQYASCTPGAVIPGSSVVCPASGMYPAGHVNGAIKCQQISGGDGFATMADGTQTYMFSFGPLSGLADIASGLPGTEPPSTFNSVYGGTLQPGDPATTDGASDAGGYNVGNLSHFAYNGAVGLGGDQNVFVDDDGTGKNACATKTGADIPAACLTGHVDPRQLMDI